MISTLLKARPLRKLALTLLGLGSRFLVWRPRTFVVWGRLDESRLAECLARCAWYLSGESPVRLIFWRAGGWWRRELAPGAAPAEARLGRAGLTAALAAGRLLLLSRGRLTQRADAWLPWKCFMVHWDGDFQTGAWRFAAAREQRPLARLRATFRRRDERPRGTECVVLGNGPSAHLALREEFADCDFIVCNTAIKSDALLRRRVVALCVADAAYFSAPHDYARALQARMREVVTARDVSLYLDAEQEELWRHRVPNLRPDRVFPVLFNPYIPYQSDFRAGRIQKNGYSVFTALLLPVAATYYRKIHLVGFDGKSPELKHYFWKHNDEFQYTDLLPSVKTVEPGFFVQKDFDAYNRANADSIAEALACVQAQGVELVMSHPSFIPPLQELYLRGGTRLADLAPRQTPPA
jgi:hypothetical protein